MTLESSLPAAPVTRASEAGTGPDPAGLDRGPRRLAATLLVLLLLAVAVIVFWPGPPDPGGQGELERYLRDPVAHGLPSWMTFDLVQNLANVAMFLPLGLLGSLALRRHNYLVVLYAAVGSGLIELTQLVFLPHRVSSLQDVLANTAGALLGLLLSIPALRRRRRRRRQFRLGRRSAADSGRRAARAARL